MKTAAAATTQQAMHRLALVLLIISFPAGPARAQPVLGPGACDVKIALAPDHVREEIEAAIRAEPHCSARFDLRVIPTEGGLYLFARDAHGQVRERVVADSQLAAMLVASWVSDAGARAPAEIAPTSAAIAPPVTLEDTALVVVAARAPKRRWFLFGASLFKAGVGVRAQIDLIGRGRWMLGVAGSVNHQFLTVDTHGSAVVYLAASRRLGAWGVRAQLGAGFTIARVTGSSETVQRSGGDGGPGPMQDLVGTGPATLVEAALLASHRIGAQWAVTGGPVWAFIDADNHGPQRAIMSVFAGLQRGW